MEQAAGGSPHQATGGQSPCHASHHGAWPSVCTGTCRKVSPSKSQNPAEHFRQGIPAAGGGADEFPEPAAKAHCRPQPAQQDGLQEGKDQREILLQDYLRPRLHPRQGHGDGPGPGTGAVNGGIRGLSDQGGLQPHPRREAGHGDKILRPAQNLQSHRGELHPLFLRAAPFCMQGLADKGKLAPPCLLWEKVLPFQPIAPKGEPHAQ